MSNKRTLCAHLTIAALTGEISGTHLYDPTSRYGRGGSTRYYSDNLQRALPDLAEGGYVIDLRPLADHPELVKWVMRAPMTNGDIEGDDIDRLPEQDRIIAAQVAPFMSGGFQTVGLMTACKHGEPKNNSAGPFDEVSSAYRARYWEEKGARIGKRKGNTLYWNDGKEEEIPSDTSKE